MYLSHKGGLGGGKNPVTMAKFSDAIQGFLKEPVLFENKERDMYVLYNASNSNSLLILAKYIHECERIRRLNSSKLLINPVAGGVEHEIDVKEIDIPEDPTGNGGYEIFDKIQYEKVHGLVRDALVDKLNHHGYRTFSIKIENLFFVDLIAVNKDVSFLFEIKTKSSPYDMYTGFGQIKFYHHFSKKIKYKCLVLPNTIINYAFKKFLNDKGVFILNYEFSGANVRFINFTDLINAHPI